MRSLLFAGAAALALTGSGCGKRTGTASGPAGGSSGSTGSSGTSGSGSTTGTSGTTGATSETERHCLDVAQAICQHDATCGRTDRSNLALCESTFNCTDAAAMQLVDAEIAAGRATFSDSAFSTCLSDIDSSDCSQTGSQIRNDADDCQYYLTGSAGTGASCMINGDCIAGDVCLRALDACGGQCVTPISAGGCAPETPIARGYACQDGGVSQLGGRSDPCNADRDCNAGLSCRARLCDVRGSGQEGNPCQTSGDCLLGLGCAIYGDGGTPGTCYKQVGPGLSCLVGFPDGGSRTDARLCLTEEYCDRGSRTCADESSIGGPCNADGGFPRCMLGGCAPMDGGGTGCAYLADGQPCTRGADCLSAHCVNPDGGAQGYCAHICP